VEHAGLLIISLDGEEGKLDAEADSDREAGGVFRALGCKGCLVNANSIVSEIQIFRGRAFWPFN
jgi:hypothetical protein